MVSSKNDLKKKNRTFYFIYMLFFFFFGSFFFSELGTEPRALRFLGKRSTTELNPQPLIFFLNMLVVSHEKKKGIYFPAGYKVLEG